MVFNFIFNSISVISQWPVHLSMLSWSSFNPFPNRPWFLRVCSTGLLKNTVGKGEIARNEQFLLFPQCFLPFWRTLCHFHEVWNCRLQTLSIWKSLKFVIWERVKQYSAQYSFQATGCFPTAYQNNGKGWERNESCHNDYHQSSEKILA